MRVVDLKTFLSYPDGVIYAEFTPCIVGEIQIRSEVWMNEKLSSCAFLHSPLFDADLIGSCIGAEAEVVTDQFYRDGPGLDPNQLYVVFDKKDIATVIERLQRAHDEAKE